MTEHTSSLSEIRSSRPVQWVVGALIILILWQISQWTRTSALDELGNHSRQQLSLFVTFIQGQLQKYEFLPELLATDDRLVKLLQHPDDKDIAADLNRYLKDINDIAAASDTYVMDANGLTLAASNWDSERPFVGRNFSYRPYFQEAMKGNLGRYFALGSTSNKRGYYFAYPVRHKAQILGAVVVKMDMASLESSWSKSPNEFIVTDPDGVVFFTTHKDWRFSTLEPLAPEDKDRIKSSQRYLDATLDALTISSVETLNSDSRILEIDALTRPVTYLVIEQAMPEAGWKVHILSKQDPITEQVIRSIIFTLFIFGVVLLLIEFSIQRSRRLREQALFEKRAKKELEHRVTERTKDLTETNVRLTQEIDEHRRTEEALRQTQDELIQSAKMATLGQISTGISHELNQPLAAIRSYADNAKALLEKNRADDAQWNLSQIAELTDRMAKISSQLKIFARKSSGKRERVSVTTVIDNSLRILASGIKKSQTKIRTSLPSPTLYVHADMVHLEQVLINLIGNALHATEDTTDPLVEISAHTEKDITTITIRDNGQGIQDDHIKHIFDPFFTTKEEGLGLGLSISYRIIQNMNGTLNVKNHPDKGAIFTLRLQTAKALDQELKTEKTA